MRTPSAGITGVRMPKAMGNHPGEREQDDLPAQHQFALT
jgi:hypothetical protein